MDMSTPQILLLLLGLVFGLARTDREQRCFSESEVNRTAERKLQNLYPQPQEPAAGPAPRGRAACPLELYAGLPLVRDYSRRSLSPWRYEFVSLPDHFPSSYVRASCLCSGCIQFRSNGSVFESLDYNSVTVDQSRIFLRREPCADGDTYRLVPVNINVPVGCTCVRAKKTS